MNGKFRIYNKTIGKYEVDTQNFRFVIDMNGNCFLNEDGGCDSELHDEVVVEFFTGLKDKNDKEIYEGDIVSFHDDRTWEVFWNSEVLAWFLKEQKTKCENTYPICSYEEKKMKVIGNIHQNKELLIEETLEKD